ncbi:Probable O-methyltransferase 3 [Linum grandiflorum]
MAIADAFSDIECTVFDLPHVVSGLDQSGGTRRNLKFVGGDMFKEIPPADIVLLKVEILKQARKAVTTQAGGRGGKVMIIDHVLGHESCRVDMVELASLEGSVRTEEQWAKLFSDAGFSNYTISPFPGARALIEVHP